MRHIFHTSLTNPPKLAKIVNHLLEGKPLIDIEIIYGERMTFYIPADSEPRLSEMVEIGDFEEILRESRS